MCIPTVCTNAEVITRRYAEVGTAPSQELIRSEAGVGGDAKELSWDFALVDARQRFLLRRKMEAFKWGSGRDYDDVGARLE